jgi:hypothetical protein
MYDRMLDIPLRRLTSRNVFGKSGIGSPVSTEWRGSRELRGALTRCLFAALAMVFATLWEKKKKFVSDGGELTATGRG